MKLKKIIKSLIGMRDILLAQIEKILKNFLKDNVIFEKIIFILKFLSEIYLGLFFSKFIVKNGVVVFWLQDELRKGSLKGKFIINFIGVCEEITLLFILQLFIFLWIFRGERIIEHFLFLKFLIILIVFIFYAIFINYLKDDKIKTKIMTFFKKHKYINILGLFLYKWSHMYFWWLEFKVFIINILRLFRFIAIKLNIEKYFNIFDKFIFLVIVIIEKIFDIFIEFINKIKIKIIISLFKQLVFWRFKILVLFTLLYFFELKFLIILVFCILFIDVLNKLLTELQCYFIYIYNTFDNVQFCVTSRDNGFVLKSSVQNIFNINTSRYFLNLLFICDANKLDDIYRFNILAETSYFSSYYFLKKDYFEQYCIIDKGNMYWYDNNLFFKDVMGGLKLVYIMNYVYMLKDLIGKLVWYADYIKRNNVIVGSEIFNLYKEYKSLSIYFKEFWELINKEEINNGQNFKLKLREIQDEMTYGDQCFIFIKLYLLVDNIGIKSVNNSYGNLLMFKKFEILREKMIKIIYKEHTLLERGLINYDDYNTIGNHISYFYEKEVSKLDSIVKNFTDSEYETYVRESVIQNYQVGIYFELTNIIGKNGYEFEYVNIPRDSEKLTKNI